MDSVLARFLLAHVHSERLEELRSQGGEDGWKRGGRAALGLHARPRTARLSCSVANMRPTQLCKDACKRKRYGVVRTREVEHRESRVEFEALCQKLDALVAKIIP
eukprot:6174562-Pleurochrysis_carterae.AAC.3